MEAKMICHPDFEVNIPIPIFHKEMSEIALPDVPSKQRNRHILFRKKVSLPRAARAILRITADDYYKLYINGRFVTQGPASSYPSAYYYNEIDVTPFLREGENTIAVHTYYQGLRNRVWVSGDGRQMLWCELELDGVLALVSDTDWRCTEHTAYGVCGIYGYDTAFAETYDSNADEVGFYCEDYDDNTWGFAAVARYADHCLTKQPTEQLELYDVLPQTSETIAGGVRLDFGREMVGYLHLRAKGEKGSVVTLRFGEETLEDGSVRYDMRCGCRYEEFWTLSGSDDVLKPFDYKAFRYVEILFPNGTEICEMSMRVRHYPYRERARYSTEHADLQRILRLCADTVKYGTQEVYVDCPTREKGQYLGDVSIAARAQAVLTGDTSMMKKAITDFCNSTFICPGLMAVSGAGLMQEIADYSLQFAAQVLWVYRTDGDMDFLKRTEPYVTGVYQHFLQFVNEDGLLDGVADKWNLVDWPNDLRDGYDVALTKPIGQGVHNVINAFWCGFLGALDEIYALLGKPMTNRTASTKKAFVKTFYFAEVGLFRDTPTTKHCALHSNVLPLLFGIGTEDEARRRRLIAYIEERKLSSVGVYMAYFALAALIKWGERELAERLATDRDCWMAMLEEGATTTFEAWRKEQKWNCSLFHPWATAPLIVFAEGVLPY